MTDNLAWVCLVFGSMTAAAGWLLRAPDEVDERRRKRVLDTPTARVADAKGDGIVELRGRIVVEEGQAPLVAPFSLREVVWLRTSVDEIVGKGSGVRRGAVDEISARSFLLDDGSGERARVVLQTYAEVVADVELIETQDVMRTAPPHVLEFLAKKNVPAKNDSGDDRKLSFYEACLAAGDELFVIGPSTRERLRPGDGYRNDAPTRLLVVGSPGSEREVIATKLGEKALLQSFRRFHRAGWVMLILGTIAVLAGAYGLYRFYTRG